MSVANNRVMPAAPLNPVPLPPPSPPVSRLRPLYPKASHRVVAGATDVRAVGRGNQGDGENPPAGTHNHRETPREQLQDPLAHRSRGADEVDQAERRKHEEGLQHLGQEAEAEGATSQQQPPGLAALDGTDDGVGRGNHEEHKQSVRVVEPEHQDGHRSQCHQGAGRKTCGVSGEAAHRAVQQADRSDAFEGLRDQHAPGVEAEDPPRELHHPQRRRGFVDRDEVRTVEGAEEERLPALGSRLHGRGVKAVRCSGSAQIPQIQQRGETQQDEKRRTGPARFTGTTRHDAAGKRPMTAAVRDMVS
jgi:hypothetical protein